MGEDDKALELGNVTFCSLTEEPPEVLPEPAHIDVHRFLEPHEYTFEVSRESVRDILYNIMRYGRRHSNNWYKLHGVKTTRKLYSERKGRKR